MRLGRAMATPPSAVLALSFSLLSQLSNPSHHTQHNSCAYGVAKHLPGPKPRPPALPRTVNGTGHTGPSEFCATSI